MAGMLHWQRIPEEGVYQASTRFGLWEIVRQQQAGRRVRWILSFGLKASLGGIIRPTMNGCKAAAIEALDYLRCQHPVSLREHLAARDWPVPGGPVPGGYAWGASGMSLRRLLLAGEFAAFRQTLCSYVGQDDYTVFGLDRFILLHSLPYQGRDWDGPPVLLPLIRDALEEPTLLGILMDACLDLERPDLAELARDCRAFCLA